METSVFCKPDGFADGLDHDEIPQELRCVELNRSSETEGMIFRGHVCDSDGCTSYEGTQMDWSDDEDEEAVLYSVGLVGITLRAPEIPQKAQARSICCLFFISFFSPNPGNLFFEKWPLFPKANSISQPHRS